MAKLFLSSVVALFLMAVVVSAQSDLDCGRAYKSLLDKIKREQAGKMPGERLAALHRRAQRIYSACQTGRLPNAHALFEELHREK